MWPYLNLTKEITSCDTAGILSNQISNHQIELVKFRNKKYIEIERYSDERIRLMVQEIEKYDIYSQLDKTIASDTTTKFDSFSRRIIEMKNRFIPRERIKFDRN